MIVISLISLLLQIKARIELTMKDPEASKSIMDKFPNVTDVEWIKRKLATE